MTTRTTPSNPTAALTTEHVFLTGATGLIGRALTTLGFPEPPGEEGRP